MFNRQPTSVPIPLSTRPQSPRDNVVMHANAPPGSANGHSIPVTQDVHIVPLAREYDRAVLPFLAHAGKPAVLHAHRIILLVPDSEEARLIGTKVEKALRN